MGTFISNIILDIIIAIFFYWFGLTKKSFQLLNAYHQGITLAKSEFEAGYYRNERNAQLLYITLCSYWAVIGFITDTLKFVLKEQCYTLKPINYFQAFCTAFVAANVIIFLVLKIHSQKLLRAEARKRGTE